MHETITRLVTSYGYLFLFVLIGLESFGIPLPGETALVSAAAAAALGKLSIVGVVAAASAGAIVGDNAGYWLGRKGGAAIVHRFGRRVGLDDAKLARAHAFFERHGAKTVFLGRFIALLRSWAAVLAGVACMPFATFTLFNALGGVTWATIFGALGYAFGHNLPRLERYAGQASLAVVLLVTVGVVAFFGIRWVRANGRRVGGELSERWQRAARSARFAQVRARHPRAWSFMAARFARGEYLGLHLTIGLLVSLAALWLFGAITEDVLHHDPLVALDEHILAWFRAHATPRSDRVAVAVSLAGGPVSMAALAIAGAVVLAWRRLWITLGGWVAAFAGGGALDWALKVVIHRPRPEGAAAFLHGMTFSFPSGHSMGSIIGFGMLGYLLAAHRARRHRTRLAIVTVAALAAAAIALSRLALGVHYFSDVIAGLAAGTVWLSACTSAVEVALGQRGLSPWQVGVERRRQPRPAPDAGASVRAGPVRA
jgi:undecaprenyl-diphosphatase